MLDFTIRDFTGTEYTVERITRTFTEETSSRGTKTVSNVWSCQLSYDFGGFNAVVVDNVLVAYRGTDQYTTQEEARDILKRGFDSLDTEEPRRIILNMNKQLSEVRDISFFIQEVERILNIALRAVLLR